MKYRRFPLPALTVLLASVFLLQTEAQAPPTASRPGQAKAPPPSAAANTLAAKKAVTTQTTKAAAKLYSFRFEGSNLDIVMQTYCGWTGQIYLKNEAVTASITLKADNLTKQECIDVVQAILGMNNVLLVPMGDKFLKVVQANTPDLGGKGLPINYDPKTQYTGSDKLATHIIQLQNVEIPEVQTAIQHLMNSFGKIQALTGSNSLMITDTESNIIRIRELIEFMDQATARIEPRIYQIQYAEAGAIASKLNEIVTLAQADQKKTTPGVVGNPNARTPPGVIRATSARGRAAAAAAAPTQATISQTEGSTTVIIQGTVKIMADERTNIILIFSQEENFDFFDKIIQVLDVEVEPAVTFEVVRLEYADAEELSSTLNELVGAAQSTSSQPGGTGPTATRQTDGGNRGSGLQRRVLPQSSNADASSGGLNKLSENTKILADKRSNAILLMGRKSDIAIIKKVIASLDIMLDQVMIEAAIFEVTLDDTLRHGIDWLYQSKNNEKVGAWDGNSLLGSTNGLGTVAAGALTYYQKLTGIDTQMAINLSATAGNIRLLNTPVIMTTDNTEARLSVGQQRPVVTSTDSLVGGSGRRSSYEYKDIGIQLTVTPHINPQRIVVMEIEQKADQLGPDVLIDNNPVPTILNREFQAQVSVPDGTTIALGGLITTVEKTSSSKIPLLGDIPLLGRYLFSSVNNYSEQVELVVLLTPYVLTNHQEIKEKTEQMYDATDMGPTDWPQNGWSDTTLQHREKTKSGGRKL